MAAATDDHGGRGRGQETGGSDPKRSLRHVQAAQLRARATRGAIGKAALGMVFLLGALSYAFGPVPQQTSSRTWMAALVVLSTLNIGLALRTFSRVRHRGARLWLPAAILWGVLSAALLRILLAR
jgi:hypothetical protein